jgi:hypothetical protein
VEETNIDGLESLQRTEHPVNNFFRKTSKMSPRDRLEYELGISIIFDEGLPQHGINNSLLIHGVHTNTLYTVESLWIAYLVSTTMTSNEFDWAPGMFCRIGQCELLPCQFTQNIIPKLLQPKIMIDLVYLRHPYVAPTVQEISRRHKMQLPCYPRFPHTSWVYR